MRRAAIAALALATLAGCADYLPVDGDGRRTATPPKTAVSEAPKPVKGDTCGAAAMQYLVGKNKSEVPPPLDPAKRRMSCTTCAVTMGYRPDRLNILFVQDTGVITAVKCG